MYTYRILRTYISINIFKYWGYNHIMFAPVFESNIFQRLAAAAGMGVLFSFIELCQLPRKKNTETKLPVVLFITIHNAYFKCHKIHMGYNVIISLQLKPLWRQRTR
jgi:hypothetical protein